MARCFRRKLRRQLQTAIPPLGDAAIDTLLSQEKAEVCLVPDKRFLLIDPGPKPGTFDLKKFNRE